MKIKTQLFQEACKTILLAVDNNTAANLELLVKENNLYLNVTDMEYYVSIKYELEQPEELHAVVKASLFLNLIAGITTEEFDLTLKNNAVVVKSNKSQYKVPVDSELTDLPVIAITNVTVDMPISNDVLKSIVNVNSKELLKVKKLDVNDLQKYYYIDETGCFTFTTGACLNSFTLAKPVKLLLTDRFVKLFKLFKTDVAFSFGHDQLPNGTTQTKVIFKTDNIYLAIILANDEILLSKIQGPCAATKKYIAEDYSVKAVLSTSMFSSAIARLMQFSKNSIADINMLSVFAGINIENNELTITDKQGNSEVVKLEDGSFITDKYSMSVNLADLKLVLDSCKEEHITMSCGNHRSVILARGAISNLIPEGKQVTNAG